MGMYKKTALCLAIVIMISACGDDSDDDANKAADPSRKGVILDSAISNMRYKIGASSLAITDTSGQFNYKIGDKVTFYLCGDNTLPIIDASEIVLPINLAGEKSLSTQRTRNIARLLQSLDKDGVTSNGIQIADACNNLPCANVPINYDSNDDDFAASVRPLLICSGTTNTNLIAGDAAITHLTSTVNQVFKSQRKISVYGAFAGDLVLAPKATKLLSTDQANGVVSGSYMTYTVNVSGFNRFVLEVPETSTSVQLDAIRFGKGTSGWWLESTAGNTEEINREFRHTDSNFKPAKAGCEWGYFSPPKPSCPGFYGDEWVEGAPDGTSIRSEHGKNAYYGFSTAKPNHPAVPPFVYADTMTLYFKLADDVN